MKLKRLGLLVLALYCLCIQAAALSEFPCGNEARSSVGGLLDALDRSVKFPHNNSLEPIETQSMNAVLLAFACPSSFRSGLSLDNSDRGSTNRWIESLPEILLRDEDGVQFTLAVSGRTKGTDIQSVRSATEDIKRQIAGIFEGTGESVRKKCGEAAKILISRFVNQLKLSDDPYIATQQILTVYGVCPIDVLELFSRDSQALHLWCNAFKGAFFDVQSPKEAESAKRLRLEVLEFSRHLKVESKLMATKRELISHLQNARIVMGG